MTNKEPHIGTVERPKKKGFGLRMFVPGSLFGRSLLILLLPLVVLQVIVITVFLDNHWRKITSRLSYAIAGEVALIAQAIEDKPERIDTYAENAARHLDLIVSFMPDQTIVPEMITSGTWEPLIAESLQEMFDRHVRRPFRLIYDANDKWVQLQIQLNNGVLEVLTSERRLFSSSSYVLLIWMIVSSIILLIIAVLFLRNQIRPIRRLSIAAERLGRGQDVIIKPEGAREVRAAARAFMQMQERIRRQIEQRTAMLAGISHDLRTPLTRMRLGLAMLGNNSDVSDLESDVREMEAMISGYLDFVRGQGDEQAVEFNINDFVNDALSRFERTGTPVTRTGVWPDLTIIGRYQALQRVLMNILTNAQQYASAVWVSIDQPDEGHVRISVRDNGPGVAESYIEDVFRPFFRGEPSRNKATGGVGLGLSIARDIANAHGGDIELSRAEEGGLQADIILPM